jgi:hypothetical protein
LYNNNFRNLLDSNSQDNNTNQNNATPRGSTLHYPELACHYNNKIEIHEHPKTGIFLSGCPKFHVESAAEANRLIAMGDLRRTSSNAIAGSNSNLNLTSSRSHSVLTLHLESSVEIRVGHGADSYTRSEIRLGRIQFVDLAGGERLTNYSGGKDATYMEFHNINLSLLAFGEVLHTLSNMATSSSSPTRMRRSNSANRASEADYSGSWKASPYGEVSRDPSQKALHVPYLNSKLTHLLKDSLGGNCKCTLLTHISPDLEVHFISLNAFQPIIPACYLNSS